MNNTFFVYDIINNTNPQVIFFYCCILIIMILIFTNINFSVTLFIGLICYSILIYYLWYNRNINIVSNKDKFDSKVEIVQPINNDNPKIVDFLYYMRDLKSLNFSLYNEINCSFSNIIFLYNSIKNDKKLVFDYYDIINMIKLRILAKIESYNLITNSITYNDKIKKLKIMAENIINEILTELYEINKKYIYYNNYKNYTKVLTKNKVLEYNIFNSSNEYIRNTVPFDASNIYVL
jgi:hypothetical protein